MKTCVLLSGGMDSTVALHHALKEHEVTAAISFHYGAKHHERELPCAAQQCHQLGIPHHTIQLPFINTLFTSDLLKSGGAIPLGHYEEDSMKRTVVPFRNGIMLAIAAGCAESMGAAALVIAAHSGDHAIYPDCRPPFMQAMAEAIREGTYARIEILAPFLGWTKARIAQHGHDLGVDFSLTWSCYQGGSIHCGACGTCVERREAFILADIPDPTPYASTAPLPPKPLPPAG